MKRLIVPTLATVFGAALLALLVYGVSHQAPSRTLDEAVRSGHYRAAPEAERSLPALTGGYGEPLAAYAGKVVLLNFWASWCAPCEQEAPLLERAQRELERHGATVLGVTYKDITSDSLEFVHRYHLTYPTLRDPTGDFAQAYGTDQLPESFVIDRSGKVVAISRGEVDEAFLQEAVKLAESS
ncbi:MAG TPA: TlpA disulfide reductase family protein [Solirubrobacteraceae bacterium]|jgi:cytochrome c biogenesis protein CcmG/thiol:disulfide interchange protein DsbE|nr:TlpA disulfide reductase family protein [Solirubrobacteraceae bacterium]